MKKYAENMADKHLIVGSIEVINEITGNGIKTIQSKVEALQQQLNFTPEDVDYWSQLSNDGLVTPVEKKVFKAQWEQIQATYTKLRQEAEAQSLLYEDFWISYVNAYTGLNTYLNTTLKVFEDMYTNTAIPSRETFNSLFTLYYEEENNCGRQITQAGLGYQEYEFAVGDETTHPDEESTEWYDAPPTVPAGKYLWMRTRWVDGKKE